MDISGTASASERHSRFTKDIHVSLPKTRSDTALVTHVKMRA